MVVVVVMVVRLGCDEICMYCMICGAAVSVGYASLWQ
jgi:hypothetical protein